MTDLYVNLSHFDQGPPLTIERHRLYLVFPIQGVFMKGRRAFILKGNFGAGDPNTAAPEPIFRNETGISGVQQ